jgi:hypothetical protein
MDPRDEVPSDPLSQLQLLVARRADDLALHARFATPLNLHCWLLAESELIDLSGARTKP